MGLQYDPKSPYLGYLLGRVTVMCLEEALDGKDDIEDGGDPAPYAQAIRLGFRGQHTIAWLMDAIKANHNDFVRLCLDSGFNPVARFLKVYLNLLATSVYAENAEAVRAFLEHGADPDEPSHFGGSSALALAESNEECDNITDADRAAQIMEALRAARKRPA